MKSANGYQVDPDEVDKVVRDMFGHLDELGGLFRQFGQLAPPVKAFGLVASPAAIAAMSTHELIQRALEALEMVLDSATQNVQTAMNNYRATDSGGGSGISSTTSGLNAVTGLVQRLQSTGLGARGIHSYLQEQGHQVGAGVAEVHVGSNLSEVRLRPGDLVTTADFTATVGADGRLYANGQPVQAATGQEARVYRTMPTGPSVR
jgi:hypothetical protein